MRSEWTYEKVRAVVNEEINLTLVGELKIMQDMFICYAARSAKANMDNE